LAEQPYNQLSGGQRQMVLIARAIAQETRIIFLDEPTSALDFRNQMGIWDLMRKISEQGIAILACSHDPNHVSWFCDKVVVMNRNGIISQGPPDHVITEDILNDVYQDMCAVRSFDGIRMVLPRSVSARVR
ncbi:MAG: ABC transporter ATP-binding protein, partial [Firmicutes bacterium]|nr:ABC transporter ATP-binding protein [Bacillota bacterium]